MEVSGKVKEISDVLTFDSGFKKRYVVLSNTKGQYEDLYCVEFFKDDTDKLDSVNIGDNLTVGFYIRTNEYQGKYYTNLVGSSLKVEGKKPLPETTPFDRAADDMPSNPMSKSDDLEDDLPF